MPPKFGGAAKCEKCGKSVYENEKLSVEGKIFHKSGCFKCEQCKQSLKLGNYAGLEGKYYCKPHFKQLFLSKGNYSEGFGSEKPTAKWDGKGPDASKANPEGFGQAKLEDSNVAGVGGKEDRAVKKAAAETESAWEGAGTKPDLEIWRIEKFEVKRWPREEYGMFYDGDSYILLKTYKKLDESGAETDALAWDVHFWIGRDSTQDEYGTAAYKTVELDTLLDDGPVQHREVDGQEGEKFLSYFDGPDEPAFTTMKGGVATGFHHVEPENYPKRLLRIQRGGKKCVRVFEVDCAPESVCKADCYLLDNGLELIGYVGENADPFEKSKAGEYARSVRDQRNGRPTMSDDTEAFFAALGCEDPANVEVQDEIPRPALPERTPSVLYKVSNDDNENDGGADKIEFVHVADAPLDKSMLESDDTFFVDCGNHSFAWVGKGANETERKEIMVQAMKFLDTKGRSQTPITRIWEGQTNVRFDAAFGEFEGAE